MRGTGDDGDPGNLRLDFPAAPRRTTSSTFGWEEWFAKFDEQGLAAVLQERRSDGEPSTFMRLVKRDKVDPR